MLYITKKHLKPGMILAKDLFLYTKDNFSTLMLVKGQILNNTYINKIKYHNIDGLYIENEAFSDINVEPYISEPLKAKALTKISDAYYEFKVGSGKVNPYMIKQMSSVVSNIVTELLYKNNLTYNLIEILNKPGKLTSEEYEIIKTHPTNAAKQLKNYC